MTSVENELAGGPGTVTPARMAEFGRVVRLVDSWAERRPDVVALGLVGSWARGQQRMDSDLDLVVVTTAPEIYARTSGWAADALGTAASIVRNVRWGELRERRVALESGLEVEFGIVQPAWASTDPLDDGTARVVADGLRIVRDDDGILDRLARAVAAA